MRRWRTTKWKNWRKFWTTNRSWKNALRVSRCAKLKFRHWTSLDCQKNCPIQRSKQHWRTDLCESDVVNESHAWEVGKRARRTEKRWETSRWKEDKIDERHVLDETVRIVEDGDGRQSSQFAEIESNQKGKDKAKGKGKKKTKRSTLTSCTARTKTTTDPWLKTRLNTWCCKKKAGAGAKSSTSKASGKGSKPWNGKGAGKGKKSGQEKGKT